MKKITSLLVLLALLGEANFLYAEDIKLGTKSTGCESSIPSNPKAPARPWIVDLTDGVITMSPVSRDYTLTLVDEDDEEVYSVFVPAGTTQITLPLTLSGNYELRLIPSGSSYYFYGYITL